LETTVRRILETAATFGEAAWTWWSDVAAEASWPPALGPWLLALFALLLLAALRRRRPPPLEVRPPQLLITQGEVVPEAGPQATPRRRRRGGDPGAAVAGRLTMTLSNLSRYPVQVLEVALRQESRGAPRVAELEAVVPPLGALELGVRVPLGLSGDGWLDVYCYAAAPRQKLHRHRAELVWEPWVSRFKVAPMEQATAAAKRLASDERNAVFELPEATSNALPPAAANEAEPIAPAERPATDATPLGALWARLPKGGGRAATKEPEVAERGEDRARPEGADAPRRPKLEFPDDF